MQNVSQLQLISSFYLNLKKYSFIPLIVLVLFTSILTGCSSLQHNQGSDYLYKQIDSIQLDGEGRGRVSVDTQRYLFDFASLAQDKQASRQWILELDFALHGSEHLVFKWEKTRWSVGGSFLGALRQFIRSSRKNEMSEGELNELLSFISEALRLSLLVKKDQFQPQCIISGICPVPKSKMVLNWSAKSGKSLSIKSKSLMSKKNMTYSLTFTNLNSGNYKLLSFGVYVDQGFTKQKELLSLSLYFD